MISVKNLTKNKGEYMNIKVCIGSSCHLKGSRQVVEKIQTMVEENNLKNKVELSGAFCMGKCQQGVCVSVNDEIFSVTPQTVESFFEKQVSCKL